ncbi:MAG: lamin tail domain-containing protein [Candidatus Eiseniibacteriota bacterium]
MQSVLRTTIRMALALGLAGFPCLYNLFDASAAACDVRLNEVCAGPGRDWNGDGIFSARDDEWIEIVNTGTLPLDLATLLVSDADTTWRWSGVGTLNPGEHRVLYGLDAVNWQRETGHSIAGFSLANAGDTARLWMIQGADTVQADAYTYRAHEAATDRVVGRVPDMSGVWALFDALNSYTGTLDPRGTGCAPTPGSPNVCDTTPAEPSTWGRVKAVYR